MKPAKRRRGRWNGVAKALAVLFGAVIAVFTVAAVVAIFHARSLERRLSTVPSLLRTADTDVVDGRLAAAQDQLTAAERALEDVNGSLYNSFDFSLAGVLPVARQNLRAVRNSVGLGLSMVAGGREILNAAAPLKGPTGRLDVTLTSGQLPLGTLSAIRSAMADTLNSLPSEVPGRDPLVLGNIGSARRHLYLQAVELRRELLSVGDALTLLSDIAGQQGDRRYFVAAANSAEMRGSGGMYLSYGILSSHDGKLSISPFRDSSTINLPVPETSVPFPADITRGFGPLHPTADWRNVNLFSDFTLDGPVMVAMYHQVTGSTVDGVIQVDSEALASLLSAIGPVGTSGLGTLTASNVVPLTLNQAYFLYPNRSTRQDYSGQAAQAVFDRLVSGRFPSLRALGTAVLRTGQERHILLYTSDPTDEAIVSRLGLSGSLPPAAVPFVQLTVQNAGGSKLDYYLRSSLTLDGGRPSQVGARVTATIDLDNTAPVGLTDPAEIFGTGPQPGVYQGFVTLYLPAGSHLLDSRVDGSVTSTPTQRTENGIPVVTYTVAVAAGTICHVELNLFTGPTPEAGSAYKYVTSPRITPTVFAQHLR